MYKVISRLRSFARDESGLIMVESLLMLPLLIWALVAIFIYWDAFRTINMTQKAAYSIADLLSRQKMAISPAFASGLKNVLAFLTPGGHPVAMRITSLECSSPTGTTNICNDQEGSYKLLFSYTTDSSINILTEKDIQNWKPKLPVMAHMDSLFVVETKVDYKSKIPNVLLGLKIGVTDQSFGQFVVTRPRHLRLCLQGTTTCS